MRRVVPDLRGEGGRRDDQQGDEGEKGRTLH
jgi:hypothetical protein